MTVWDALCRGPRLRSPANCYRPGPEQFAVPPSSAPSRGATRTHQVADGLERPTLGVGRHCNRGGTTQHEKSLPRMQVLMKQPQVVVTAELFVDGFWPTSDRNRGIRRRIQMYFVGTSSRWRLCCAQLCASFLSAIRPRVGPGHIPTFLRLSASHSTHMAHPTTPPPALTPSLSHTAGTGSAV